jgi:hypothetical protein
VIRADRSVRIAGRFCGVAARDDIVGMGTQWHVACKTRGMTRSTLRNALFSGTVASIATTASLAVSGALERGDSVSPSNGPSQWLWGRRAAYARGASLRHTFVGYVIHHATAVMWATLFERLRRARPDATGTIAAAATTSALAYVVDYKVVPHRLQPGFDAQVSRPALGAFYVTFAAALAIAACTRRAR